MPRKIKSKSVDVAPIQTLNEDSWRERLDAIKINDDHWWCMVTLVAETSIDDFDYTSTFVEFAEDGYRRTISAISREKLMSTVRVLSKPELDECPVLQGICHYAMNVIREKQPISTLLMAKLIKFMIYRTKAEMVGRTKRERDLESEIEREILMMQTVAEIPPPSNTEKSKKIKCILDENSSFKANTRLRRRGEEWRDKIYVDDAPDHGPNLYITLTGFYDPELPIELSNTGVPLTCILKVKRLYDIPEITMERDNVNASFNYSQMPSKTLSSIEEDDLDRFWASIENALNNPELSKDYEDYIFRSFCPPTMNFETYDAKKNIYDRMSFILFDIYDLTRQYAIYMQNTKLQNIFEERPEYQNLNLYSNIMNAIPEECISVPILLQTLLLQVEKNVASLETTDENSEESIFQSRKSSHRRSTVGSQDAPKTTSLTKENSTGSSWLTEKLRLLNLKCELISPPESDTVVRESQLILHADSLTLNTYHATEAVDAITSTKSNFTDAASLGIGVLKDPRIKKCWSTYGDPSQYSLKSHSDFVDFIIVFCGNEYLDRSTILHYLNLIGFDELESRARMSDIDLSSTTSPLRFHTTSTQSSVDEDNKSYHRTISEGYFSNDKLEGAELLPETVFQQLVYECSQTYDQCIMRYFEPSDSLLLIFKNTFDEDGITKYQTSSGLRTPVSLQTFCRYTIYEEEEWFKEQEMLNELEILKEERQQELRKHLKSRENSFFTNEDFYLPGSLKAIHLRLSNGDNGLVHSEIKNNLKSVRRSESNLTNEQKKILSKSMTAQNKSAKDLNDERKSMEVDTSFLPRREVLTYHFAKDEEPFNFIAYDLGNCRVEVSNISETFFSIDGTRVRVDLEEWLNSTRTLSIAISYPESDLIFHSLPKNNQLNLHSFHLTTKSGIRMVFSGASLFNQSSIMQSSWMKWNSCDFQITWPSGLIIKLIPNEDTNFPFYVLQKYNSPNIANNVIKKELKRKYLRNGEVLKYMNDGTVVCLRSNGTIITYTLPDSLKKFKKCGVTDETKLQRGKRSSSRHLNRSKIISNSNEYLEESERPSKQTQLSPSQSDTEIMSSEAEFSDVNEEYRVLEHDGRHYQVCNDVIYEFDRLRIRTASEYSASEKFIRRADSTDMLLNITGDLLVSFPDGTRTVTSYDVEKDPITCEWLQDDSDYKISTSSSVNGCSEEKPKPLDDSFVSIVLNCRMEHPNYASVTYHGSSKVCTLSMPGDVEVDLLPGGDVIVKNGPNVEMKVQQNTITYFKRVCDICDGTSTSTFQLPDYDDLGRAILTTSDMLGNIFEVSHDGSTSFTPVANKYGSETGHYQADYWDTYPNEREDWQHAHESDEEEHLNVCLPNIYPLRSQRRIFAMNRNLTAYEYHHRSVMLEQEKSLFLNDKSAMLSHPISDRPNREYRLTFIPPTPLTASKAWLQPYKIPEVTPSYDKLWIFPECDCSQGDDCSPDNSRIEFERIWFEPLIDSMVGSVPPVLITRVLEGITRESDNAIMAVQHALSCVRDEGCYYSNNNNLKTRYDGSSEESTQDKNNQILLEIKEYALGIRNTLDAKTYLAYHSNVVEIKLEAKRQQKQRLQEKINAREKQKERLAVLEMLRELLINCLQNAMIIGDANYQAARKKATKSCYKN